MVPSLHPRGIADVSAQQRSLPRWRASRLIFLAALFTLEALLFTLWLDGDALASRTGFLLAFLAHWGAWILRGMVGAAAMFVTFAYLTSRPALAAFSSAARREPVSRPLLAAHSGALAVFCLMAWEIYGNHPGPVPEYLAAVLFLTAAAAMLASAAFAFIAPRLWLDLLRHTGRLWIFTIPTVVGACVAGAYFRQLWAPAGRVTFALVTFLLRPFLSRIVADTSTMTLGSARFSVQIAPECSGFEGVGLVLAFGILWLCLFRKECRFPQAFLLLPMGALAIFLLNSVRIAALILIGDAGAPDVAVGGFHSQAGWIAFTAVALGFTVAAARLPWITTAAASQPASRSLAGANPTAAYLLPFLSILAAGTLTTAVSAGFEWLYPVRLFAAALTLYAFRGAYRGLNWKPGFAGLAIGGVVFALWVAADLAFNGASLTAADAMPAALSATSATLRLSWIAFRILAATVTVPIAEELAFRGFLSRRFVSADFESVPLRSFTWLGVGVASVAFGLLHGGLWPAGIAAGLLFQWAVIRRGRIADAIVAHAAANALLAAYVLMFHQWHLW